MANVGGIGVDEGLENDGFEILEGDVKVSLDGHYPEMFSDRVQEILDRNMESIGYKALFNIIQILWKPMGSSQVIDIDSDYYLVKFVVYQDYTKALTKGPWVVYGNYLTV